MCVNWAFSISVFLPIVPTVPQTYDCIHDFRKTETYDCIHETYDCIHDFRKTYDCIHDFRKTAHPLRYPKLCQKFLIWRALLITSFIWSFLLNPAPYPCQSSLACCSECAWCFQHNCHANVRASDKDKGIRERLTSFASTSPLCRSTLKMPWHTSDKNWLNQ